MDSVRSYAVNLAMHDAVPSYSVVIVGGGPVGLALANELGYRGIDFLAVDELDGSIPFPAGEAIFSRTMEHLRRWGIADRVRFNPGFPPDLPMNIGFATSLTGNLIAFFRGSSNAETPGRVRDISPEGIAVCPKQSFDPELLRGARSSGHGEVRFQTRLTALHETAEGVVCDLLDLVSGEPYSVLARYVAGCDGARSTVRKHLGVPFVGSFGEGHNFAVSFRAPGLHDAIAARFGERFFQLQTVNTPRRPYFTTVDGGDLWRMSMYVERGDDPDPAEALAAALGFPLDFEIVRSQPWAGHRVVAQSYGRDRMYLLGDAAHLRWPKGGFGANTGIGDAVDFGWKVAAVLEGWGGAELLRSYEAERRPIAIRNVNEAANNRVLDALIEPDPALDEPGAPETRRFHDVENAIHALRLREFRTQGVQLGYRYRQSPICVADGSMEPPDDHMVYSPSTWPGCRAPHAWLSDTLSTLDLFGRGFVLLRFEHDAPYDAMTEAASSLGIPFAERFVDAPEVARLYERPFVLVRPDGHVAWRGDTIGAGARAILDRARGAAVA